ncbi:MAG: VWA domain-containing protein [Deltaproteobacteria bacterium]|nr:VWA domain-containing protein [Deltaproteobacteria bacterium]
MSFLPSIIFGQLGALALAASLPALVLAYWIQSRRAKKVVSSIFVFQGLPRRTATRARVKLPPRFFLELLAMALLVLAAMQPFLEDGGEDVAILLDNSLSMQTRATGAFATRFEQAVLDADTWARKRSDARFALYVTSPALERLSPEWSSASAVLDRLRQRGPSAAHDNVQVAVRELAESGKFDRILVVSDRSAELMTADSGLTAGAPATRLEAITVGTPAPNLSIENFREDPASVGATGRKMIATLQNSSSRDAQAKLHLYLVSPGTPATTSREPLRTVTVSLPRDRSTEVPFLLPIERHETPSFAIRLESTTPDSDSLDADNSAWLTLGLRRSETILLVTPSGSSGTLGLEALSGFNIERVDAERFSGIGEVQSGKYLMAIFHRVSPPRALRVSSLYLVPPAGNSLFPVRGEVPRPVIASWDENHPLLTYLNIAALSLPASAFFDAPPWTTAVMNIEQGPAVLAGESQGIRFAATGFELLPFEGAKTPASSVLLLNLVNWLSNGQELSAGYLVGSTFPLRSSEGEELSGPDGRAIEPLQSASSARLPVPGMYTLKTASGGRSFPVNAFFAEESSTFTTSSYRLPAEVPQLTASADNRSPLWPQVLLFVAALVLTDALFVAWRKGGSHAEPS